MMYITAKSKLTGEWLYINTPISNINVGKHFIDIKTLSGKWDLLSNLYYSIMITNTPIKVVDDE